MLKFDSRDTRFKQPFGAVKTEEKIQIVFPVEQTVNVTGVALIYRGARDGKADLHYVGTDDGYNVFRTEFSLETPGIYYYRFEIYRGGETLYAGRASDDGKAVVGEWLKEWQLTVYDADFKTADWLKGKIIYHIFPDRFKRIEDGKRPLFGRFKDWSDELTIFDPDGVYRANDFYGGNIKGIISELDYLVSLGVGAIYLSPIFESHSNHRYDTGDYMKIDPLFGTEKEFITLVGEADKRGIGIILDGVFNHTGADSLYFNKFGNYPGVGAYQSPDSPYYDWYTFTSYPDVYDCWWGVTVVPTVKRNCSAFQKFIAGKGGVIEKWTSMGVKGWRLDVADELSSDFIEEIRKKVKSMGDIALIGEVWEDASTKVSYGEKRKYLFGDELDGTMNYPFRTAILNLFKDRSAVSFVNSVMSIVENYPKDALYSSMSLLGTHDTVRIVTALGDEHNMRSKSERLLYRMGAEEYRIAKTKLKAASALQYFLPGLPTVYYGDEIGMQGYEDPINRRPFARGFEDTELLAHYRYLGQIHPEFTNDFSVFAEPGKLMLNRGQYTLKVDLNDFSYKISKKK